MANSATSTVSSIVALAAAFKAASEEKGSPSEVTTICNFWRQQGTTPMDEKGNTMLHILCMHGNAPALKKLVDDGLLKREDVRKGNKIGDTPLHTAAMFGHQNVSEILLDLYLDLDLVSERNYSGETPLYSVAATVLGRGRKKVFKLLADKLHPSTNSTNGILIALTRNDGSTILHAAIMQENYSLAIRILELFPKLAERPDAKGVTPLDVLATKPMSFYSGSSYCLENLGNWPLVPIQLFAILFYYCIPSMRVADSDPKHDVEEPPQKRLVFESRWPLAKKLLSKFSLLREIYFSKKIHQFAVVLAKNLVAENNETVDSSVGTTKMENPLIEATKKGIRELVDEILKIFPYAAASSTDKNTGRNILQIAVEQKDRYLYGYLIKKTFANKDMLKGVDGEGNNILHLAANLGSSPRVHLGNLNQMSWDVCWFKRVLYDAPPSCLDAVNEEGKTPTQVFIEKHSELMKKSETELKEMNNGLMLVSALIGTVSYASLFTVPGGFGQDSGKKDEYGIPVLLKSEDKETVRDVKLFMWYNGLTLFFSLLALGTMLSVLLSRFRSRDFYLALPFRFISAMTALFCSIIFVILACFQTFVLETIPFHQTTTMTLLLMAIFLFYFDTMYPIMKYMWITLSYSSFISGKGQEVLALLG